MKKRRLLSVLTSAAILATTIASSIVTTVSAATTVKGTTTDVITLKPEKSSFSMEEVSAGTATAKVSFMFDSFDDADEVTMLLAKIKSDSSHITFKNLTIENANALTCKNDPMYDAGFDFFTMGTDPEDTSVAQDTTGFFIQNDGTNPFIKNDLSNPVATFDVIFDSSTPKGTYTVSLDNGTSLLSATQGTTFVEYFDSVKVNKAVFTIGDGAQPTTAAPTVAPTAAPTADTLPTLNYIGDCKVWADKAVVGTPGGTVTVNMYADTNGVDIRGFEARAIFDSSKLTLTNMTMGKGFAARPTINKDEAVYVLASATNKVKNDPKQPFAVLTFTVSENAKPGDVYEIDIEGSNGEVEPIVNVDNGGEGITYLKPSVTAGSVVIEGATEGTEDTLPTLKYIGDCKVWADKAVVGTPGGEVTVNMYADTNGVDIRGFEARAIFNSDELTLTNMTMGKGFAARPTINKDEAVYVLASATNKVKNDPKQPFAVLTFTVSENAKPGDEYFIDIQGSNGEVEPIVNVDNGGEGITYLKPTVEKGSVVIEGATEATTVATTAATTAATTVATTVATTAATTAKTDAPNTAVVTSISIVTEISYVPVTSIEKVTEVEKVTSIEKVTEISYLASEVEKVTVTEISYIPVTSYEKVTSVEKITEIVTVTSIVPVPGSTSATTGGAGEITIETNVNVDKDSDQWYHADNVEFFKNGIVVKDGDGNDITDEAVIKFAETPGSVYDGKNFDYEVEFTVEVNGETLTGTIPVKIGPRGDSNKSAGKSADIYDAIIIAKFILPKPAADIPAGSFQEFLADNNEDGVVNIYDAINVAKLILPANGGDWSKVSKDYSKWIKD